jgi:diguanylate cyclase (GGDEF)-like protein
MFSLNSQELERIRHQWKQNRVGLIYLDIARLSEWEERHGRAYCEHVLSSVKSNIVQLQAEHSSLFKINSTGDDFFFFVALKLKQPAERQKKDLLEMGMHIKLELERMLRVIIGMKDLNLPMEMHMGTALLAEGSSKNSSQEASAAAIDKLVYIAVKQSIREAQLQDGSESSSEVSEFLAIMENQSISSVYQPIVSFEDARIFGYEALTRGPVGSVFHSPIQLFQFAERENMLYMLDRLAREKAVSGCTELQKSERVFINIPAHVIHDPQFTPGQTLKLLEARGLTPHNVVFEITERSSIEDFSTTKKLLQHYRSQGYQIAIDDAGAGYSSLQAIAELQPDFIKVDRSLIQDIHKEKIKENILETFISFAEKMNIRIIAEGIEKMEELMKLMQMGVHLGQGYLIARPAAAMAAIDQVLVEHILRQRRLKSASGLMSIGQLAAPNQTFAPETYISEVANCFKANESVICSVIVSNGVPIGLIMRDKLFQQLAGQYGLSLYWNRPISQLMDRHPLIIDEQTSIDQVSQMATSRDFNQLYDYVVITAAGQFLGAASVRSILESITKARVEYARIANPLTGLPGNVQIQRELTKRLMERQGFSVIYADLDFFKWFNDRYGFHKGDRMIQFTADVLQEASRVCGHPFDFVGHIGGDDFIVITNVDMPDRLCEEMIQLFKQGVGAFYEEESHKVFNREGQPVDAEGVSLSLSLIICQCFSDLTPEHISQEAAKLKKRAKSYKGSIYVYQHLSDRPSSAPQSLN